MTKRVIIPRSSSL